MFVSQYSAYHSPLNFRDPDSLIPERWLDGTGFEKDSKEVLQPFSFGPRNCLGKKFAPPYIRFFRTSLMVSLTASHITRSG